MGGQAKIERYHDKTSQQLLDVVHRFNVLDPAGSQQVKCWEYSNGWNRIQSLSRGDTYFYHSQSGTTTGFGVVPDECKDEQYADIKYQDQGSRFTKPPKNNIYARELRTIQGIKTNAYILNGDLFRNTVNMYLVELEPPLTTKNVLERRGIVLGRNNKEKRRNSQLLNNKFGFWAFDNHKMFSMGSKAHKNGRNDELPLNDDYKVQFLWKDQYSIDHQDIPITEEEQILNIFKRKAMKKAQFNNVRDAWFYKDANTPPHPSMRPRKVGNKATVLSGYECSMRINTLKNGQNEGVFKADIASKLVSQMNVNSAIYRICEDFGGNFSDPAFQSEARRQLEGKYFIMRYSNQSIKIHNLDFTQDENGTFEMGQEKVSISYKDYIFKQYGLKADAKEMCMLTDQRGSAFLPQFAYLTLRSDECADDYDQILRVTNQPIAERLDRVNNLVKILNKSENAAAIKKQK